MKKLFGSPVILPFILFAAIFFESCKEDTIIKAKVAPGIDGINVTEIPDTFTILTKSVKIDTLNTSKVYGNLETIQGLGTVSDPFFGRTTAGVYFQVVPTSNSFNFSANPYQLDSAFIILPFFGFKWGDTAATDIQKFTAWELIEPLTKGSTYYSNEKKQVSPLPISDELSFDVRELRGKDSTLVNGIKRPEHLRIKLKNSFVQKIANEAGKANFDTKETFLKWFNGIYISADSTQPGKMLPYFFLDVPNITVDYSRAAIEFNFTEGGSSKTAFFNFIREDCAQYNYISRNYSQQAKDIFNSTATSDKLLLQNEPGAAIDVRIPYLKNLPTGVINKAQLLITKISTGVPEQDKFFSPARILPYRLNADGSASEILDLSSGAKSDFDFVGGTPSVIDIGGGIMITRYTINLPREVQKIIIDKTNELHLRIKGAFSFPAAYSLVAGSRTSTDANYKFQLNIVYSTPE